MQAIQAAEETAASIWGPKLAAAEERANVAEEEAKKSSGEVERLRQEERAAQESLTASAASKAEAEKTMKRWTHGFQEVFCFDFARPIAV